jgi:hypothetical protein
MYAFSVPESGLIPEQGGGIEEVGHGIIFGEKDRSATDKPDLRSPTAHASAGGSTSMKRAGSLPPVVP